MRARPFPSLSLFDLERAGVVPIALVLLFLAAGLTFFFLSFSQRHGRSRWPLHALMALGIVAIGSGLATAASAGVSVIGFLGAPAIPGGSDPASLAQLAAGTFILPFWLGLVGMLLGLLAAVRAILGLIREPGPRF